MKFKEFAIIPAVATMFDKNGNIDALAQRKLVEFLTDKNVDALYVAGATGNFYMLDINERKSLIQKTIEAARGKTPSIVYIGCNDTKCALELATFAAKEGAAAISSLPPTCGVYKWEHIRDYYKALADSADIPLIVYNNETMSSITPQQTSEILNYENCIGVKSTLTNHFDMQLLKTLNNKKLVLSGVDEMISSAMISGVDGAIGSSYNIVPELYQRLRDVHAKGDMREFMRLTEVNVKFIATFFNYGYSGAMKASLEFMGIGDRHLRQPLKALDNGEMQSLKAELIDLDRKYDLDFLSLMRAIK